MQESFYKWISIREYQASDLNDLINANYPIDESNFLGFQRILPVKVYFT
jgi:hypothetical protein